MRSRDSGGVGLSGDASANRQAVLIVDDANLIWRPIRPSPEHDIRRVGRGPRRKRRHEYAANAVGDEDDSDDEDQVGEDGSSRTSHRNLPTWSDAIGILVDSNLVLHSKSPGRSSSSRGQGGRGRGGRGRSGPKKS